jgi:hypothetical protein
MVSEGSSQVRRSDPETASNRPLSIKVIDEVGQFRPSKHSCWNLVDEIPWKVIPVIYPPASVSSLLALFRRSESAFSAAPAPAADRNTAESRTNWLPNSCAGTLS